MESVTIIKTCTSLIKFLTVPDTNSLIVNIKFMKIKVTVGINLKRPNYIFPSCHLVGRHLTFPVANTRSIPWMEFGFPTLRSGRL